MSGQEQRDQMEARLSSLIGQELRHVTDANGRNATQRGFTLITCALLDRIEALEREVARLRRLTIGDAR